LADAVGLNQRCLAAARKNNWEATFHELHNGAWANCQDTELLTPLMWAATYGNADAIVELADSGALLDQQDRNGWTAALFAASSGQAAALSALYSKGADLNMASYHGETVQHIAARKDNEVILQLVLTSKSNIEAQNIDGDTPLQIAAHVGSMSVCRTLLACGAEVLVKNHLERTPFAIASAGGHASIVQMMLAPTQPPKPIFTKDKYQQLLKAMSAADPTLPKHPDAIDETRVGLAKPRRMSIGKPEASQHQSQSRTGGAEIAQQNGKDSELCETNAPEDDGVPGHRVEGAIKDAVSETPDPSSQEQNFIATAQSEKTCLEERPSLLKEGTAPEIAPGDDPGHGRDKEQSSTPAELSDTADPERSQRWLTSPAVLSATAQAAFSATSPDALSAAAPAPLAIGKEGSVQDPLSQATEDTFTLMPSSSPPDRVSEVAKPHMSKKRKSEKVRKGKALPQLWERTRVSLRRRLLRRQACH